MTRMKKKKRRESRHTQKLAGAFYTYGITPTHVGIYFEYYKLDFLIPRNLIKDDRINSDTTYVEGIGLIVQEDYWLKTISRKTIQLIPKTINAPTVDHFDADGVTEIQGDFKVIKIDDEGFVINFDKYSNEVFIYRDEVTDKRFRGLKPHVKHGNDFQVRSESYIKRIRNELTAV